MLSQSIQPKYKFVNCKQKLGFGFIYIYLSIKVKKLKISCNILGS